MTSAVSNCHTESIAYDISGKHLANRTSIYCLGVFPNVTPWPPRSFPDAGRPLELNHED
jgi:hypothetical protein